jgi:hypothetical protein
MRLADAVGTLSAVLIISLIFWNHDRASAREGLAAKIEAQDVAFVKNIDIGRVTFEPYRDFAAVEVRSEVIGNIEVGLHDKGGSLP